MIFFHNYHQNAVHLKANSLMNNKVNAHQYCTFTINLVLDKKIELVKTDKIFDTSNT